MHETRDEIFSVTKDAGGLGYIIKLGAKKALAKRERKKGKR
jgi:hypothetical protein